MSKSMKKLFVLVSLFVGLTFTFLGLSLANPAYAQVNSTDFYVEDSASLRIDGENKGMRFSAYIGTDAYDNFAKDEGAYGMIIVPAEYVTNVDGGVQYKTAIVNNGGDFIKAYESLNTPIIKIGRINPYAVDEDGDDNTDYYKMHGVISNVKYQNLNREFIAIAYYAVLDQENDIVNYTYSTTIDAEIPSQVLYEKSIVALADKDTEYAEDQNAVLDEYRYLSEQQKAGVDETTAKDNAQNYVESVKAIRADLTGDELLSFDVADYSAIVSEGSKIEGNAFTAGNYSYSKYKITLPNPILVRQDSVLVFSVKSPKGNSTAQKGQTYISFDGTSNVCEILSYGEHLEDYRSLIFSLVDDLGRVEGEVVSELYFTAWNDGGGYTSYDYIKFYNTTDYKPEDGVLVDFAYEYKIENIKTNPNAHAFINNLYGINNNDVAYDATENAVKIINTNSIQTSMPKAFGVSIPEIKVSAYTQISIIMKNNGAMDISKSSGYDYSNYISASAEEYQTVTFNPVSLLGVAEGSTFSQFVMTIGYGEGDRYCLIKSISVTDEYAPQEDVIVDFLLQGNKSYIQTNSAAHAYIFNLYGISANDVTYDTTERAVKISNTTGTSPCAFVISFPEIILTADTKISIVMKNSAAMDIAPIDINQKGYDWAPNISASTDDYQTFTFTVGLINHGATFLKVGDNLSQLAMTISKDQTCYIKSISVSNAG